MTSLDERSALIQSRVNEVFQQWKADPETFDFCQQVRSTDPFGHDAAMMEEIANKVCGHGWEYIVHQIVCGDPVCVVTLYVGDKHD